MAELPDETVEAAERLTRLARRASDDAEAAAYRQRRDDALAEHGYTARIRTDGVDDETLVCHPEDWAEDGTVHPDRVDDVDRGIEVPLDGPGEPEAFDELYDHNHEIAERVRERHGHLHGENAAAFAEFVSNHYAKPIESVTPTELEVFRTDYYPRNVWPEDGQAELLDRSLEYVFETADVPLPENA